MRRAELDALIIVGDDQKELFYEDHLPSILVYYGDTIRNVPLSPSFKGPEWSRLATARYYEEKEPRDYPVDAPLALHLIEELIDPEFDIASSNGLPPGHGEGHAHAFVRKRLMEHKTCRSCRFSSTPITRRTSRRRGAATILAGRSARRSRACRGRAHRHCRLGQAQPFCRRRGAGPRHHRRARPQGRRGVQSLPRKKLNSGSSEIRMWIAVGGAVEHLDLAWSHYVPGYRTPAGSGTGLGFAVFQ